MTTSSVDFYLGSSVQKIALPHKEQLVLVEVHNVIRCKSDNSYTEFIILNEQGKKKFYSRIVVSKGFYHFEEVLMSSGLFFRIHNQHIINVNFLSKIVKTNCSYVLMDDDTNELLPIARSRKKEFFNFLKYSCANV